MLGALLLNEPQGSSPPAGPPKENIVILGYGLGPLIATIGLVGAAPSTSNPVPKENIVILGYGKGPLIPTIGLVGAAAAPPSGVVPKENIVILGYGQGELIATIGLVGGKPITPPPPAPPAGAPRFGGGPFWREYGYDSAYDAIRNQTSTQAGPARGVPEPPPFRPKPIDYHFIQKRAFGSVAADMRAFWESELADQRRAALEEEELMIVLSLLDD